MTFDDLAAPDLGVLSAVLASLEGDGGPRSALEWGDGGVALAAAEAAPGRSRWRVIVDGPERAAALARRAAGRPGLEACAVPPDGPPRAGAGELDRHRSYVLRAAAFGSAFDLVVVRGEARRECLRLGWELVAAGGALVALGVGEGDLPAGAHRVRVGAGAEEAWVLVRERERAEALARRLGEAAAPRAGRLRCVFVNTYYPEFLARTYRADPGLSQLPYAAQHAALQRRCFGDSDFYSQGLRKAGWEAFDLIVNCGPLQARWAAEQGVRAEGLALAVQQIRALRPDVVYLQDLKLATPELVGALRPEVTLVAGQIASALPPAADLGQLDVVVSSFPHFVQEFREQGHEAWYQPLAFEPRVLAAAPEPARDVALSFVGGVSSDGTWGRGTGVVEAVATALPLEVWGYGAEALPAASPLRQRHHGEAWGLEMFEVLRRSRLTLNRHSEAARHFANNMRLFEATGCGALLLTEARDNLGELFRIGEEVVAYRSPEEAVALARYYLAHPDEAAAVARAGQARTLREHTYERRMAETAGFLEAALRRRRGARPGDSRARLADLAGAPSAAPLRAVADALAPFTRRGDEVLLLGEADPEAEQLLPYLLCRELACARSDRGPDAALDPAGAAPRAAGRLPFPDGRFHVAVAAGDWLGAGGREALREAARVASRALVVHGLPVPRGPSGGGAPAELAELELVRELSAQGLRLVRRLAPGRAQGGAPADVTYAFVRSDVLVPLP